MVMTRNNRIYQIIGAVVLLLVLAGTYAYAGLGVLNPTVGACKNFCSLAGAEYDNVDNGDCYCLTVNSQIDLQNDRLIQVQSSLNAGKIRQVAVVSPIPQDIQNQIAQQLQQQQMIQQQQTTEEQ